MENSEDRFEEILAKLNQDLPLHSMWDGFWIRYHKRGTLILSCSFDRIYYRNYDIIFKDVIFYNIPSEWRDTDVLGDELIRQGTWSEFRQQQPDFDPEGHQIFAIDLLLENRYPKKLQTFFIIAKHIYLEKCEAPNASPLIEYVDIFDDEPFPCFKNRVL